MIVALVDIRESDPNYRGDRRKIDMVAIRWKLTFIGTIVPICRSYTTLPYLLFCTKNKRNCGLRFSAKLLVVSLLYWIIDVKKRLLAFILSHG